ncbi:MAG: MCE family protein [Lentisphaerae bacterium]|jgi:phospholipid/cholesterol/gamma-HCH transport system substrate-binding protein|nr:MCE family protein [Lentisphaerota bacterium]
MKFRKQLFIETAVGLFSFAVIAALVMLTVVLSQETLFRKERPVEIVFEDAMGLRVGDAVNVRGVNIGKVKDIVLKRDGVHVMALLNNPLFLRDDYRIEVLSTSVLGGRYLSIHEGTPGKRPMRPQPPILQGHAAPDLMDTATRTIEDIRLALNDGILEDLKVTMAQVRKIATNVGEGVGTLGKLITDEAVYDDVQEITANLRGISEKLGRGEGTLGQLLMGDDQAFQDLAATLSAFREVSETIARGEGTLGKLITDEDVYDELQGLLQEGRAALDDIRENSPILTFTSVFFGVF